MLHACAAKFDVTRNLENFLNFRVTFWISGELNKVKASHFHHSVHGYSDKSFPSYVQRFHNRLMKVKEDCYHYRSLGH